MTRPLPDTWRSVKLGVCLQRRQDFVMPSLLSDESVALVGLEDIQDMGRGGVTIKRVKPREIASLKTRFASGDILYGKLRPYLNKVGIAPQAGFCSTEIWALTPVPFVDSRFVAFFLASSYFVERVASLAKGANLPRLDTDAFDSIEIPIPPLSEQVRIAKILQEADELRRVRNEASEKASLLIPAMFFERFVRGKEHTFRPLHKVAEVVSGVALGRKQKGITTEVPYLRVANVQAGRVDLRDVKTTPATNEEIQQFKLVKGDILVTEGGDFDKLGRGSLWEGQVDPCIHQNHVFRVRPVPRRLNSVFFAHYLQSAKATHYFLRCAKRTTNLASINLTQLKALPVPVISLEDQERFAQDIQEAEACGTEASDRLYDALVNSLSAHAFSGQLTEAWREAHRDSLTGEARARDAALKAMGALSALALRSTIETAPEAIKQPQDGIYSNLAREQEDLLIRIQQRFGRSRTARYFTAQSVSESLEGPLRRNPQGVAGHLAVFAARGLVIPVSREEQTEDTGEFVFGNAYRLPLTESDGVGGEQQEPIASDHVRLREMERLLGEVEREGALA